MATKARRAPREQGPNREVALVAQGRPYGTPTTLTDELADKIAKYVRLGDRPFVAAEISGVNRRSFYDWMAKGEADILDALDTIYARFHHKIEAAESYFEHALVISIKRSTIDRELPPATVEGAMRIPGDPKIALSVLARRRDGWQERREITGKDGAPLHGLGLDEMGDDEIEERLSDLRKRRRATGRAARTAAPARTRTKARSKVAP